MKKIIRTLLITLMPLAMIQAQQLQTPEGFIPSNRTMSASLEKNLLFNATTRYKVTQPGLKAFSDAALATLFDGSMSVAYTEGVAVTESNPLVILIENLPEIHTQAGGWIGFSTRYWQTRKFKIEGYDTWNNHNQWVQFAEVENNQDFQYVAKVTAGAYTKLRLTFLEGCPTSDEPLFQMGLSEIYFIHPEATQAYDGLLLKANDTGNVAIGSASGTSNLDVYGNLKVQNGELISSRNSNEGGVLTLENAAKLANGTARYWRLFNMTGPYGNSLQFFAYDNLGCQAGGLCDSRFTILDSGNVGIGTTTPKSKLQLGDTGGGSRALSIPGTYNFEQVKLNVIDNGNGELEFVTHSSLTQSGGVKLFNTDGANLCFQTASPVESYEQLSAGYQTKMILMNNGNVGIGTTTPDAMLTVNGVIHAREVKVDLTGPLADYVFATDYPLMPLHKVESYVKTNNRLPDMPSADEVKSKGLNMGEMQNKLLQKIEELTLYTIQQQKQIQALQNKLEQLEKQQNSTTH